MNHRITTSVALALLAITLVGCDGESDGNLSTRATDDPGAYRNAKAQAEQAEQRSRRAEDAAVGDALRGIEGP